MAPPTIAQMISDGRVEARRLHDLAEAAEPVARQAVGVGPPRELTAQERAVGDYVATLRLACRAITVALDECQGAPRRLTPQGSVDG